MVSPSEQFDVGVGPMMFMAFMFGVIALGLFVAAIIQVTKARWGMVAILAILAFAVGGAAGTLAAAA